MMFVEFGWNSSHWSLIGLFAALLYVFALVGAWAWAAGWRPRLSR
jgi:hypothetical protein